MTDKKPSRWTPPGWKAPGLKPFTFKPIPLPPPEGYIEKLCAKIAKRILTGEVEND